MGPVSLHNQAFLASGAITQNRAVARDTGDGTVKQNDADNSPNAFGIAKETVSSGADVLCALPGDVELLTAAAAFSTSGAASAYADANGRGAQPAVNATPIEYNCLGVYLVWPDAQGDSKPFLIDKHLVVS